MAIKPLDIRRKEFKNSLRGYDQNQVDDFLDTVADEFEKTFSENQRMKDQVSTLRERLEQFDELEGSIRAALVHAEQAASDLRQSAARDAENTRLNAQRESDLTIQEAKARSHQMLADTSGRLERVQESYDALREARGTFAADFRHLLQTYMSVMENMDVATAQQIETSLRERLDPESIAVAREAAATEAANASATQSTSAESTSEESTDVQSTDDQATIIQAPPDEPEPTAPAFESMPDESTTSSDEAPAFESSQGETVDREYDPVEDPGATQRMVPGVTDYPEEQPAPEAEEPEVEPSTSAQKDDDVQETDDSPSTETEEPVVYTTEEPAPDEDDTQERTLANDSASEGFFEERREPDERTSRAGRFLRRRG